MDDDSSSSTDDSEDSESDAPSSAAGDQGGAVASGDGGQSGSAGSDAADGGQGGSDAAASESAPSTGIDPSESSFGPQAEAAVDADLNDAHGTAAQGLGGFTETTEVAPSGVLGTDAELTGAFGPAPGAGLAANPSMAGVLDADAGLTGRSGPTPGAVQADPLSTPAQAPAAPAAPAPAAAPAAAAPAGGGWSAGPEAQFAAQHGFDWVDPASTRDPAAVQAAQQAYMGFFNDAAKNYSIGGYSTMGDYMNQLGGDRYDSRGGWLGNVEALANGGAFHGQGWNPGVGWSHNASPLGGTSYASQAAAHAAAPSGPQGGLAGYSPGPQAQTPSGVDLGSRTQGLGLGGGYAMSAGPGLGSMAEAHAAQQQTVEAQVFQSLGREALSSMRSDLYNAPDPQTFSAVLDYYSQQAQRGAQAGTHGYSTAGGQARGEQPGQGLTGHAASRSSGASRSAAPQQASRGRDEEPSRSSTGKTKGGT